MNFEQFSGLSSDEVAKKKSLGLSNTMIDTKTPSVLQIFSRNMFNISNLALFPLIGGLFFFEVYRDVLVLLFFLFTSATTQTLEEMSVKKRLEQLKTKFKYTAKVFRDGMLNEISAGLLVKEDIILAEEGDTILTDGIVLKSEFLQIDESALTGESDYINKDEADEVLSGSFVVTGKCVYKADKVGNANYFNRLAETSTKLIRKQSKLEQNSTIIVYIFTFIGFVAAALNFVLAKVHGETTKDILIGVTTVVGNSTPQMLLIILLVTFIISVTKLAKKGILIQKQNSIDELATIDVICMDKTGTITTNDMVAKHEYIYNLKSADVTSFLAPINKFIYGVNKTAKTVFDYYQIDEFEVLENAPDSFDQIPFTSKTKFSAVGYNSTTMLMGAITSVERFMSEEVKADFKNWLTEKESEGFRIIVGLFFNDLVLDRIRNNDTNLKTNSFFALAIEETLNPGIKEILRTIKSQNIAVKIISGDSLASVLRIVEKVGIKSTDVVDLSQFDGDVKEIADSKTVFARAIPENKLAIIEALQEQGQKVAMIGDGVNDVLSLKKADVGIAMESGAPVARNVADIVLLKNDYTKIPEIFYEGDNIIFNIKLTAKMYFARAILYGTLALVFAFLVGSFVPINPTSTLISGFLGSTLASYLLTVSRQEVTDQRLFMKDIISSSIPVGFLEGIIVSLVYFLTRDYLNLVELNTAMIMTILGTSVSYTLFLLWKSGKIPKNPLFVGIALLIAMFVGTMQTLMPIWEIENLFDQMFLTLLLALGIILLHFILSYLYTLSPSKSLKRSSYLIPIVLFPLALVFPSRGYYAVTPIPASSHLIIYSFVGIFILTMLALHYLVVFPYNKFETNKILKRK
ncbi:HAD-IC family P-type ATPase [Candidatus Dojkabacteria bacterium]|uniref:HAD-IC family P-type ATPase n=1 Tax=Candidatus Dojkabacteria bacterium TaxID=2099670 RepID=A0A955RLL5_9BACT|nr:HAD-IC family P-type ATPase [Candidatus Dojkabacteria bacterium]